MPREPLGRKIAMNASVLAGGRLSMAAIGVLSVGIAARYLGLEDYGSFVAAQSLAALLGTITDIGLWSVGVREIARRPQETQRIVSGILSAGLVLSALAVVVGVAVAFALYGGDDDELTRRGTLLLMTTIPLSAPFGAASAYFIAQQRPYMGTFGAVAGSAVTLIGLVIAVQLDWGFNGVVACYVSSSVVQWIIMVALVHRHVRLVPSFDFPFARQLLVWSLPLGGTLITHSLYWRLDVILLSVLATAQAVALYGVAVKVVEAVLVLPNFILITLLPEFARLASDPERFHATVQKAFSVMQVGGVGIAVFVGVFAPQITETVGGPEYAEAGNALRILMVAALFAYPATVFGDAFFSHDKQHLTFYVSLAALALNIALNLALIPIWGLEGAAAGWALCEVALLAGFLALYRRELGPPPRVQRAAGLLAAGLASALVGLAVKELPGLDGLHPAVSVALGAITCLPAYLASLYAFKAVPPELHQNVILPLWTRLRPG